MNDPFDLLQDTTSFTL